MCVPGCGLVCGRACVYLCTGSVCRGVSLIMLISYVFVAACSVYLYWCVSDWRARLGVCECVIRADMSAFIYLCIIYIQYTG